VIIGENRTFDHVFATYQPKNGETVSNLLSKGIVKSDGTPGPDFSLSSQSKAYETSADGWQVGPSNTEPYSMLPPVLAGGYSTPPFPSVWDAKHVENGLPNDYYIYLTTGGTGLNHGDLDTRIPHAASLPNGPFQLTSSTHPYDSYDNSPVHRFYQMWQQFDCSAAGATTSNPSGCKGDLFPWVETTIAAGSNGLAQPAGFSDTTTKEGSTAMGFYNMLQGDAPYTKELADNYAMSDNYHQPVMGGTGANSIMLGFGDAIWFSDENGNPLVPPHNAVTFAGGPVEEIENPNPVSGTNNWWTQDGYGGFGNNGVSTGVYGGGSYSNCSDTTQPGVGQIVTYLGSLAPPINPNCDAGHYYLLNNYNPGYFGDGSDAYTDSNPSNTPFTIPGTTQRSIADVLMASNVSWKSYNDQWDRYLSDKYQRDYGRVGPQSEQHCNICNPFQYQKQIMTNAAVRTNHIVDTDELYKDIKKGTLPAVSYVKPSGWVDGHPASSKWDLYEGFVKKIVDAIQILPADRVVVVVGHSNTVGPIVKGLGGDIRLPPVTRGDAGSTHAHLVLGSVRREFEFESRNRQPDIGGLAGWEIYGGHDRRGFRGAPEPDHGNAPAFNAFCNFAELVGDGNGQRRTRIADQFEAFEHGLGKGIVGIEAVGQHIQHAGHVEIQVGPDPLDGLDHGADA